MANMDKTLKITDIIRLDLPLLYFMFLVASGQSSSQLRYQLLEEQSSGYYIANVKYDSNLRDKYNSSVLQTLKFQFLIEPIVLLSLGQNSGVLETNSEIDRDMLCPGAELCEVTLDIAIRPVQYFEIIKVILEILDLNDIAPTFPQTEVHEHIQESAQIGSSILLPAATDSDSPIFSVSSYSLYSLHNAFQLQVTDKIDGTKEIKLLLTELLDHEKVDVYNLRLIASDGGDPSKQGVLDLVVNVVDSNDNRPVFDNMTYKINIQENLEIGTTIIRVHASDSDAGLNGVVQYTFSTYSQEMHGSLFRVNRTTGVITVIGHLDFEAIPDHRYMLYVLATDKGMNPVEAETTVIINILDQNDNIPHIGVNTLTATNTDTAHIFENVKNDTFVAHITVKDDDSDNNGQVDCSLNNDNFKLVQMYAKEYKIVTQSRLDRESKQNYDVVILCIDRGNPRQNSMKHVEVVVDDVNDNKPEFEHTVYNVSFEENMFVNASVCTVTARDRDTAANGLVLYSLPYSVKKMLIIDPFTGVIKTLTSFDREKTSSIQFEVTARDRGTPAQSSCATVIINVKDVNDEPPRFSQNIFSFSIKENQDAGTEVGMVHAIDNDAHPFNQCEYSIIPGNESWKFLIDAELGVITSAYILDREESHMYYITVRAMDKDSFFLTSTAQVIVHVEDINDNKPIVVFPKGSNGSVPVSNKAPSGYLITRIIATDADFGNNAKLVYQITSGNGDNLFKLHTNSGYLTSDSSLVDIMYKEYTLEILIADEGEPSLSTTTVIEIVVDDSIPFTAQEDEKRIIGNSKIAIIISLSIASSFLTVILIIAIICMKRLEKRRSKVKKHQSRMENLKMLSIADVNMMHRRKDGNFNHEMQVSHLKQEKMTGLSGETREENPPDLWASHSEKKRPPLWSNSASLPSINQGDTHTTIPCNTTTATLDYHTARHRPTVQSTDPQNDTSADGSNTTDSGVGGDVKISHPKLDTSSQMVSPGSSPYQGYSGMHAPLKTFSIPTSDANTGKQTTNNNNINGEKNMQEIKHGHSSRANSCDVALMPSEHRNSQNPNHHNQRKGAIVNVGDDAYQQPLKEHQKQPHEKQSIYHTDPVRSRTYYRDTPMYSQNQQHQQYPLQQTHSNGKRNVPDNNPSLTYRKTPNHPDHNHHIANHLQLNSDNPNENQTPCNKTHLQANGHVIPMYNNNVEQEQQRSHNQKYASCNKSTNSSPALIDKNNKRAGIQKNVINSNISTFV